MTPAAIAALLIDSADDITSVWGSGPMKRVNALNAVRAVLPPPSSQAVYVADHDAENTGAAPGRVVAIEIDPLTGLRLAPADDKVIALKLLRDGITSTFTNPTAMAVSPSGEKAYVVVTSTDPALGDGVLEIGTLSREVRDFIPFSGAQLARGRVRPTRRQYSFRPTGRAWCFRAMAACSTPRRA